jgi:choline dehydrogenase
MAREQAEFDVVVVGAGSAGAPVAARLSEDPALRVALVEAGPDYLPGAVPEDLLDGNQMSLRDHDWRFRAALGHGREVGLFQGKVVGGGSAVGNTVAVRGVPGDFEEWAALGNGEWSWDKVLPFFLRLEDDLDFSGPLHGAGGPVPVRRWRDEELTPLQAAFRVACEAAGFPYAADHNAPESTGVGPIPSNRRDAFTRVSTATGYLDPARGRGNLTIIARTLVNRVLFDGDRACGVEVLAGDGPAVETLSARVVVLAAGAVSSPAILLRSGIGPREELDRLGIQPRSVLPGVGAGLIDQPRTGVFMVPKPGMENFGASTGQVVLRTAAKSTGDFNDMNYAMVNGFDLSRQLPHLREAAGADRVVGIMAIPRRMHSRGRVTLASADPRTAPVVDLNYLSDDRDHVLLGDAVRTAWELADLAAIRDFGERVVLVDQHTVDDEGVMRDYVRLSVDSAYNPVGSVRMGPDADPAAVVDQRCAVRGVEGLYVADASIMPTMVRANTNLTVVMIGERFAALLAESGL